MADRLRIAFLGTGGIAAKHSRYLKDCPDVEIVAGCDLSTEAVEGLWARTWPDGQAPSSLPPAFTEAEKMYADARPDGVVICTPHTLHFDQGMQALDEGCHVLMEKPMVTDADHAYTLRDKVEQTDKIFLVAYNTPCSAEFAYLRNAIREQTFGKLEMVNGYLSQGWRGATRGKWRQDPALSGGGQAYDSGAHLLASLTWSVEAPVEEVFALVDNMDTPVDINSCINIRFRNGVFAAVTIGGNCPTNGADLHYLFDNGKVDIDGWSANWIDVTVGKTKLKYPPITDDMDAGPPAQNWVESILGKAEPRTGPNNGIIHSELMDAIYESARTGQPARPKTRD